MKLACFEHGTRIRVGLVAADGASIQPIATPRDAGDPMIAVITAQLAGRAPQAEGAALAMTEVRLRAPIARPSKNVLCVGKNYRAHAAEFTKSGYDSSARDARDAVPEAPIVFTKAPCTMTGAHEDVVVPWELTREIDYEGELGVVIGRPGRAIGREDAYDHVFGYTVINDVTARDLQARHKQWLLGKSIDTFCPIGPWIVSADELDPANLELSCWVNGELRQQANTRDLIFDIPTLVATLSASMTLETGDIIATGTPAGVGIGFDPPRFLARGDVVRVAISHVGEICNTIT
jgi:2-keto-4-pentenoate hydratase/2-oxohepta-3-ene-1,7-dioic acid hydratase in catechol pathway